MEFLLDNSLANLGEGNFLLLYIFVIFLAVVALAYIKSTLDLSYRLGVPAIPPAVDSFETAYLRGGPNELARTLVFSLRQKGYIVILNDRKPAYLQPSGERPSMSITDIERRTLDWIGSGREVEETFKGGPSLVDTLANFTSRYQNKLEIQQLLTSEATKRRFIPWKVAVFGLVAVFGIYKIVVGILTGNVESILPLALGAIGIGVAYKVGRLPHRTRLGDLYLDRLKDAFQGLRQQTLYPSTSSPERVDGFLPQDALMISVGIFGMASVTSAEYGDYKEAYKRANADSTSSGGGGCGSAAACSSAEGATNADCSCGASSCGGGSCGGGCGGGD